MWIVRGIVGLTCILFGILFLLESFKQPIFIVGTMIFFALGLWAMGWVSRFAPKKVLEKDAVEELKIRNSPSFGFRNRLMGFIALVFGCAGVFLVVQEGDWNKNLKALLGAIMFIVLGVWYLFKGRKAESDAHYRRIVERSKSGQQRGRLG